SHVSMFYSSFFLFFFNDTPTPEIYTLSLHDALPIWNRRRGRGRPDARQGRRRLVRRGRDAHDRERRFGVRRIRSRILDRIRRTRSEEHTSELQSRRDLVCRLLLEKKKKKHKNKQRAI